MDTTPMLELFFHPQNQSMATFGAKEKDGDSMLSSPERGTDHSKEAEGGLEEQKRGDTTQLPRRRIHSCDYSAIVNSAAILTKYI